MKSEPETFEEAFDSVVSKMRSVMLQKQLDYSSSNIMEFEEKGVLVRAFDKIHRLKNLIWNNNKPNFESINDTWLDLANYAIIAQMLKNGWFELPMDTKNKETMVQYNSEKEKSSNLDAEKR